jgi:hypothetical protein
MLLEDMGIFFFNLACGYLRKGEHTVARRLDMRSVGLGGDA